ncbi:MAG: FtsX-like permease family protein [Clostridium sp.]|nr:FtsX-like permease family protein [Clostridium sp.]
MLSWRIACRYLLSRKSHNAVNVISIISVAGVAVATAAIVIVMSVFNGFSLLAAQHLSEMDADVKVVPAKGKTIANADSVAAAILEMEEAAAAEPVIEERALAIAEGKQMPVIFKGVSVTYGDVSHIDSLMIDGQRLAYPYGMPGMQESVGVALGLDARPGISTTVDLYAPRRQGRINPANPQASFRQRQFMVTGVFQVNQPEYDNEYVIIPIDEARELLEYTTECTAIEVSAKDGDSEKAAAIIAERLGPDYKALSRGQQEEVAFRMISIEKWVTFLMLAFILAIASFNIISTLSLLVIEKRENMATLRALGATSSMIRGIFMRQGWLITMAGGAAGVILGAALSLTQQYGRFIKLNGDPSMLTIDSYPVKVEPLDLAIVLAAVAAVAFAASLTTKLFISKR